MKPNKEQCRNAIAKLTNLIDEAFVESPSHQAGVSNNSVTATKQSPQIRVVQANQTDDEFGLRVLGDGELMISEELAAFIATLAIAKEMTLSKTALVNEALRFKYGLWFNRADLRQAVSNIGETNAFIRVQTIGVNRRFMLTDKGKKLVEYSKHNGVRYLSKILNDHKVREFERELDQLLGQLRAGLRKAA